MITYNYLTENLLIPGQAFGFVAFLGRKFKGFVMEDLNRIRVSMAEKRFAPKIDPPALFVELESIEVDQEDYAVYNYFPTGAFIGKGLPIISEKVPITNFKVVLSIEQEKIELNLEAEGIKWLNWPIWETLPIPDIALGTEDQNTGHIAATYQYVTLSWKIRYLGKVFDIWSESSKFSVSAFLSAIRKFFPPKLFVPIILYEFPLPDKSRVVIKGGGMFWATLTNSGLSEIYVEDERRLLGEVSFSTRQLVVCSWRSDQMIYFPILKIKERRRKIGSGIFLRPKEDP